MAMAAGRAGRPRGRAKPREDGVWRRRSRRPSGRARRRGRAGVDNDGGAAELDAAERGRDDEIDVVDRKVEDEPVDIYRLGPFSPDL